jgi:hypothetical protein
MLFLELFIKVIIIDIQNLLNQNFFYSLVHYNIIQFYRRINSVGDSN